VLTGTFRLADRAGIEVRLIEGCYDVDTRDDLRRLEDDLASAAPDVAPHMRAWFNGREDDDLL
jgi:hypothetical protein